MNQEDEKDEINTNINQRQGPQNEINNAMREDYYSQNNNSINNNPVIYNDENGENFYIYLIKKYILNNNSNNNNNYNYYNNENNEMNSLNEQNENNTFPNKPLFRKFIDKENIKNEIIKIRRYLVINIRGNDVKTTFKINSNCSSFNPLSEIINFTKSNSMSQIINLYMDKNEDINIDDDIKFNWQNFIIDEKHISEQFEIEENKINENNENNNYDNDWGAPNNNAEGFEIECPFCKNKNMINGNETEFICKQCKSNLFA